MNRSPPFAAVRRARNRNSGKRVEQREGNAGQKAECRVGKL